MEDGLDLLGNNRDISLKSVFFLEDGEEVSVEVVCVTEEGEGGRRKEDFVTEWVEEAGRVGEDEGPGEILLEQI